MMRKDKSINQTLELITAIREKLALNDANSEIVAELDDACLALKEAIEKEKSKESLQEAVSYIIKLLRILGFVIG